MKSDLVQPFWDHIEELRFRLIKSLAAVALGTAVAYPFVDRVIQFLAKPVGQFIFLQPTEALMVRLKIALSLGLVIAIPVVLFQFWQFVGVAARGHEKKFLNWALPISYILFLSGFSFGFFVLVPIGIRVLLGYGSAQLTPTLSIDNYINFVGVICLTLGCVFQMPLAAFFLAKIGVISPSFLSQKRRMAILLIYIASAFLTPGPDPVTALLLALPTYLLFECSILACYWAKS